MCFLRLQHGCGHYDGPWQPLAHLRRQFHFQLPGQVLPLELCILSNVGRDHPLYLLSLEQQAESEVVHSESTRGTNTEVTGEIRCLLTETCSCPGCLLCEYVQSQL